MKLIPDQKFFIFDVESVGLHGEGFAVAGGVYDIRAVAAKEFAFHCMPTMADHCDDMEQGAKDREWIRDNVTTSARSVECPIPWEVRERFWQEWEAAKEAHPGILMFVECGWPVEARFLLQCIEDDPADRNWSGPYPMHEIATLMLAAGMDPMATYDRQEDELPAHEPLADSRLSARLLATAAAILIGRHNLAESMVP